MFIRTFIAHISKSYMFLFSFIYLNDKVCLLLYYLETTLAGTSLIFLSIQKNTKTNF